MTLHIIKYLLFRGEFYSWEYFFGEQEESYLWFLILGGNNIIFRSNKIRILRLLN